MERVDLRPRRDFQALEQRRKKAAKLFAAGTIMAAVARALQASRQSVLRWYRLWKRGGITALRGAGRAGRKARIDVAQRRRLDQVLREGAQVYGFRTDLWTLPRIATVIERLTGVRYHPGHVWKILRSMNWTLQRPAKRARERNEEAVRRWVSETWPSLKKTPDARRPGSSSKTKAASPNDRRSDGPGHPKARRPS